MSRTVCTVSDADLTLHEAAELLGVHYMTAYRYVRLGVLPANKVGGTWQVTAADLRAFQHGAPAAAEPGNAKRRAPWAARLEARLMAGDARGAWGVIEAALAAGTELEDVYLDVITPAMRSIGARWEAGDLDIAVEHRASGIAHRLIGRLGPRFGRRGRTRGTVLLGTPPGERHSLPMAMLGDLLRGTGWEVSDIGADLPVDAFVRALQTSPDVTAIGVSISSPEGLEHAPELFAALTEAAPDVPVVVGGVAVRDREHAVSMGATGYASTAREFAELLDRGGQVAPRAGA